MKPKYIFLRKRRLFLNARMAGVIAAATLIGIPAELENGIAAEPGEGTGWVTTVEPAAGGPVSMADTAKSRPTPAPPPAEAELARTPPQPAPAPQVTASLPTPEAPDGSVYRDPAMLQAFAASAYDMIAIGERWRPVIERATALGPDEAAKARRAQATEMAEAVRNHGLTLARYREIFQAAQKDPRFKSYLLSLVRSVDMTPPAD